MADSTQTVPSEIQKKVINALFLFALHFRYMSEVSENVQLEYQS